MESSIVSTHIKNISKTLSLEILNKQFEIQPSLRAKYTQREINLYLQDTEYYLAYLSESIAAEQIKLFTEYIIWAKNFLCGLGIPENDLLINLELIQSQIKEHLPPEMYKVAEVYLAEGINTFKSPLKIIESFININDGSAALAQEYLDALLKADRQRALNTIMNAYKTGTSIKDIYLNIFQVVQLEVGRLWQTSKISVAQEHYITASTQVIMSQLYPYLFGTKKNNKNLLVTCINGELHELGARMIADFFEMDGWNTYYLGANSPAASIIKTIENQKTDVLAISATMTFNISAVSELINKVRKQSSSNNLKIVVGGYPFKIAPNLWKQVGADGFAADAQTAVAFVNQLVLN